MKHKGTANFVLQRASAVVLLPLIFWFVWSAVAHATDSYAEMRAWLAEPMPASFMALLIVTGAVHMRVGLNEIIDDYADPGARGVYRLLNLFACLGAALIGVFSLYTIAF